MNILHVIKSLGRGGAETLLPETLKVHTKGNQNFHYIYFLPWKDQLVNDLRLAGGKVECVAASSNIRMIRSVRQLEEYVRKHNIDLIHAHLPWAGFTSRLLRRRVQVPVIYTEHNKQERYHWATRMLNRWSFNMQDLAIAVSEDVNRSILDNISPSIPVRTILNGVNTAGFDRHAEAGARIRHELGIPHDAVVIGSLGVFRSQKRLDRWLQLIRSISDSNPQVRGLLVGDGPLREQLLSKRKELGLDALVYMPGLQTNARDWYSAMDIFMMTSEFEGLPLALLEAMSCRCSVVATGAGGIKEVIRNGVDGFICSVDQWEDLIYPLRDLLKSGTARRSMGEAARVRIEESFSIRSMVVQLEELYEEYAGQKRK